MTVKEFKSKMTKGAKVHSQLYWYNKETKEPYLQRDYGIREVGHVQSNSYAFNTPKDGKIVLSWADWPKATQIVDMGDGKVKAMFEFGFLLHNFNTMMETNIGFNTVLYHCPVEWTEILEVTKATLQDKGTITEVFLNNEIGFEFVPHVLIDIE